MCYCSRLCLLLQVLAVVGCEPANLGLWVDYSTDVVPPLALPCLSHFPTPGARHEPSTIGWWGTCYTNVLQPLSMSSTLSSSSGLIWTRKLRIMSCCSTDELQPLALPCVSHFLASAAGHEPSTMGWWDTCPTNVLLPLSMSSTPSPSSGWIWTRKLRFMSWLFYWWVTTTGIAMCFSFSCSCLWTWTLDHGMLRYMFYQGATAIIYVFYSKL
jgi:hypothetical protein